MSTFPERLQVRITAEQRDCLEQAASDAILAATPMAVPEVDDLLTEVDTLHDRHLD